MTFHKTWATVFFTQGEVEIEATFNYETKGFSLTHSDNDLNVTFKDENIDIAIDRAKCVMAALKYIKSKLEL